MYNRCKYYSPLQGNMRKLQDETRTLSRPSELVLQFAQSNATGWVVLDNLLYNAGNQTPLIRVSWLTYTTMHAIKCH